MRFVVAITGASGVIYGEKLIEVLLACNCEVKLLVTEAAKDILAHELKLVLKGSQEEIESQLKSHFGLNLTDKTLEYIDCENFNSPICSGSYRVDGMIVCPCSMATLASIASGISSNLLERAADVTLKEKRPLIIVPRETPLNQIQLENMLKLSRAGASIVPAMPAFYQQPKDIEDLVLFVVGRVLDLLKIEHNLYKRWEGG